jgi:hypothetical protein
MKLITALEAGLFCGLTSIGECVENTYIHLPNLFPYEEMAGEMTEIYDGVTEFCNKYSMNKDDFYNMPVDRFVRDYGYEYYYENDKDKSLGHRKIRRIV